CHCTLTVCIYLTLRAALLTLAGPAEPVDHRGGAVPRPVLSVRTSRGRGGPRGPVAGEPGRALRAVVGGAADRRADLRARRRPLRALQAALRPGTVRGEPR